MDITYAFGIGDGDVSEWTSPADVDIDGDGFADAVALDFDGDGLVDDVMWDADGDGVADAVGLDVDALGADGPEQWFTDPDGLGTWPESMERATVLSGPAAGLTADAERTGVVVDADGDGTADTRLVDADGDGYLDSSLPLDAPIPAEATADPPLIAGGSVRRWQGDASS